jgi:23S rRNA (uridine2552-2'-O)-methyltransferase
MRDVQDHYFHLAKKEGYVSRAAYKLIEIDDRKKILRKGDRVLDCGAAPGSWLQVAAKRVGDHGIVIGIDLQPIKLPQRFDQANIKTLEGDFTATDPQQLLRMVGSRGTHFDAVLSDMAPKTTGDPFSDHHQSVRLCHSLLDQCDTLLKPGGNLVMKVFEGEAYAELVKRTVMMFSTAKGYKPKASRSESTEMYVVATGFKASAGRGASEENEQHAPVKSRPSAGWQTHD